ncbi:MAG TPA: four-carbon acid sugar kinase family protein [Pseudonocardiaceae bacterium]|nr:four-carbon acid sugar kinase family protein [Pseudonocardiaceae bacterium]
MNEMPVRVIPDALAQIRAENERTGTHIAVLDDDPTGTQTVAGVPVLTSWSVTDLRWALERGPGVFFVLTNTRSVGPEEARARNAEIAANLSTAATNKRVRLVSRCDSTLRGHYPLETDVHEAAGRYDAMLFSPAYLAAGRITMDDVHWNRRGTELVPIATTEYARDATFGYRSSNLRDFILEKTGTRWRPDDITSLDLTTIRTGGPDAVRDLLLRVHGCRPVIVNAVAEEDLEVVTLGVQLAEREGRRFLHRSGPSLVRVLGGLPIRPPLRHEQLYPRGPRPGHGLVVVGSHVGHSTRQVAELLELPDLATVVLDVPALLASGDTAAVAADVTAALGGSDVLIATSRELVRGDDPDEGREIAGRVSRAIVDIVSMAHAKAALRFVVAKGGITSSDIATSALKIRRAEVLGQLFPGMVSVWLTADGEADAGLPFVVFAGNVGDTSALADAVTLLRGQHRQGR